jgi:hypothetical protein
MRTTVLVAFAVLALTDTGETQEGNKRHSHHVVGPEAVAIHEGFYTGQAFRDSSEGQQNDYAAGLVDGMLLAPLFGAPKRPDFKPKEMAPTSPAEWLENCIQGMTNGQVVAILSKYLVDHPERRHQPAGPILFAALAETCPQPPHP